MSSVRSRPAPERLRTAEVTAAVGIRRGITPPVATTKVAAAYTQEARDAGIEGRVVLEAVLQTDGTPTDINVVRSLDNVYGLDRQAVDALNQWRFQPATKDGKAVAVRLNFTFRFTLSP